MSIVVFSCVQLFATTWASQAPLLVKFPRPEYWSGLSFPTPRDLHDPGIEIASLASRAMPGEFFIIEAPVDCWERAKVGELPLSMALWCFH